MTVSQCVSDAQRYTLYIDTDRNIITGNDIDIINYIKSNININNDNDSGVDGVSR